MNFYVRVAALRRRRWKTDEGASRLKTSPCVINHADSDDLHLQRDARRMDTRDVDCQGPEAGLPALPLIG